VFLGTQDLMPAIDLADSQSHVWRPRTDYTWVSTLRNLGGPTTSTIKMEVRIGNWNAGQHTITPTILAGGGETVEAADVTVTEADPYDPAVVLKKYTFNLAGATGTWKDKLVVTGTSAVDMPHIESVFTYAE
jgi:hypothetical protein